MIYRRMPRQNKWALQGWGQEPSTSSMILDVVQSMGVSRGQPYTQRLMYFTALRKKGIPSRLIVFPYSGHWPGRYEMAFCYNDHLDWFHQSLGGQPAPWDLREHARNRTFGKPGN